MKNLIKLLSVLLCIVLLLAACDKTNEEEETTADQTDVFETVTETETETETEPETDPETEPDTHAYVEPVLDNFFGFEYVEDWNTIDPNTLSRLDVDSIIAFQFPLLLYVERDVDVKNTVTETYTAYNLELDKVVLEVTHSYVNGNFGSYIGDFVPFDEDGKPAILYPESMLNVTANTLDESITYLTVIKYEFTVVDQAIREENPDASYYEVKKTYEYYDAAGTLLTTANHELNIEPVYYSHDVDTYRFGTCNVAFDEDTGLALSVVDASGVKQFGKYDVENAVYGYLLNHDTYTDFSKEFLEVYKKRTGELIQRYYYNAAATDVEVWVLRNGDILIQEEFELDADSTTKPDFIFNNTGYTLSTYILDVETGVLTPVEFAYYIYDVASRDDFAENYELDEAGITPTENVINVALAYPIDENARLRENAPALLVLDNDLEIMFTLESVILEQDMGRIYADDLGIRPLKNGYLLISLYEGAPAPYAIVNSDGEIVNYVTNGMTVVDQYIVANDGVYSFEMECLYDFTAGEYTLVDIIGHNIILSSDMTISILDNAADASRYPYDGLTEDSYKIYYSMDLTAESLILAHVFDEGDNYYAAYEDDVYVDDEQGNNYRIDVTRYYQKVTVSYVDRDYVITYDNETGKYTLWNADLTHVLTTDNRMNVIPLDEGKYIIQTEILTGFDNNDEPILVTVAYTVNK